MSRPLMIISDNVASTTGLARVSRELAFHIHANLSDTFHVGTLGFNGGSKPDNAPFPQWVMPKEHGTCPHDLPYYWRGFAGGERGTILAIGNYGWFNWLANPESLPDGMLKEFLRSKPFEKWIYVPVDGHTSSGKLPKDAEKILSGFDRVLAYTKYGAEVIERTMQTVGIEYLPHGLDTSVFRPRDRATARRMIFSLATGQPENPIKDDVVLLGIVATNSARKDWHLAFEICAELLRNGVNIGLWIHTQLNGFWDIPTLALDAGMKDRVIASHRNFEDKDMSWLYSACDLTLGIGSGGGWEIPLAESLACGVPAIHGNYAGGAEFIPQVMRVDPVAFRGEGWWPIIRPVYRSRDWADKVQEWVGGSTSTSLLPEYIAWDAAWPRWAEWLCNPNPMPAVKPEPTFEVKHDDWSE